MTTHQFRTLLDKHRLMPAIVMEDAAQAVALGKAFLAAGLPILEITFRTAAAADVIRELATKLPDMCVGAGTVLTLAQLDQAVAAGAAFIVAPGLNPDIVKAAQSKGLPVIPGVMTPSEIEQAMGLGLDLVKFFPAEAAGGVKALDAYRGPYPNMRFMPTGGVGPDNMLDYLSRPNVAACGGSWMAPEKLLRQGQFSDITELSVAAVAQVRTLSAGKA